jgi:hypothetical protein
MNHRTLGQPPRSLEAGYPAAAAQLRAQGDAIAARALEKEGFLLSQDAAVLIAAAATQPWAKP